MTDDPLLWGDMVLAESFRSLLSPELLAISLPSVPRIDCQNCRRVKEKTASFDVRCCDVVPVLPNFLVGEILAKHEHPVVNGWIDERRGDPFAIWVPPVEATKHLNARHDGHYGLPCPLLIPGEGRCSVYAQRPALCVSYHCYYPNTLWQEAWTCLASVLDLLQDATSRYLVTQFDLDLQQIASFWSESTSDIWDGHQQKLSVYQNCWQHWEGQEVTFYRQCYDMVRKATPSLRSDIRDLHRQQLWDRLEAEKQLSKEQKRLWNDEFLHRNELHLQPIEPDSSFRLRLQQGTIPAEEGVHTIYQLESMLLWYLRKLQQTPLTQWWEKLFAAKEIKDKQGINIQTRE